MFGLSRLRKLTGKIPGLLSNNESRRWLDLRRQPLRRATLRVKELAADVPKK
jgi:hypothetical protein